MIYMVLAGFWLDDRTLMSNERRGYTPPLPPYAVHPLHLVDDIIKVVQWSEMLLGYFSRLSWWRDVVRPATAG